MARILLVEDNEMNRDVIQRALSRRGHDVIIARDGREGVDAARETPPDLILMDLSLPEMDGWEATRILRAEESTATVPIIALTAHAMQSDRHKALEAGCDDVETKPVDFPALLEKIERILAAG